MVVLRGRDPSRSKYVGVRPGHRVAVPVTRILARISFVEDIPYADVDLADPRAGVLHLLVGGHVRGARFFDSGVLAVGQLRGKSRVGDGGGQDRQPEQTVRSLSEHSA